MADRSRYFDHAATTPVDPRVLVEMLPFFGEEFGNEHSLHSFGQRARAAVDLARERVATAIGAEDPSQIIFTSGATEACALALNGHETGVMSPFEHSAVSVIGEERGFARYRWDGTQLSGPDMGIRCVMAVNNVTGRIFDHPRDLSDCTQALGKIPIDLAGVSYAAFSAHKIYGPKGIGALYAEDPTSLMPLFAGGGQEFGFRGGTLNVAGIVGFGLGADLAQKPTENAAHLRSVFLDTVRDGIEVARGAGVPHILGIAFAGVQGESIVLEADAAGFAISAGPACSAGSGQIPSAIAAENLPEEYQRGFIRVSFGAGNTEESTVSLARAIAKAVESLRKHRA